MRPCVYVLIIACLAVLSCSSQEIKEQDGMIWLEGSAFWMGSDQGNANEKPPHQVSVDGFWIDKYPVTNKQFTKFVAATQFATYSEQAPDAKDYPNAKPELLVPGSENEELAKRVDRWSRVIFPVVFAALTLFAFCA